MIVALVPAVLAAGLGRAGDVLVLLLDLYALAILAVAVMSWFPLRPGSPVWPVYRFLMRITDPVLARVRAAMPGFSSIDISPMVVLLAIFLIQALIKS